MLMNPKRFIKTNRHNRLQKFDYISINAKVGPTLKPIKNSMLAIKYQ
ncbi:hypothetical protein PLUTE_a4594 [Pseudoalteromonas luteoviolacea DSM 6061]|nr:hypothetical protein [Pseudoalteromonas luteoviolacea DSM 6061]